jgi:hypothetical protein
MKNKILIISTLTILSLLFVLTAYSQNPRVKNLNMEVINNQVQIQYDLEGMQGNKNQHRVELLFVDQSYNYYQPEYITGDIGPTIPEGRDKKIVWDVMRDDISLSRKIRPQLLVNFKKQGGPANAFLSLLIPGMGDFFVENTRDISFKPYYRTALTLGLVGLGIKALDERIPRKVIRHEDPHDTVLDQDPYNRSDIEYQKMQPWLFRGDGELFLGLGVALWLYDIYWVYQKGSENRAINNVLSNTSFSVNQQGVSLGYRLEF